MRSLYNARTILVGERLSANPRVRFFEYQTSLQQSQSSTGLRRSERLQEARTDFENHLSNEIMRNVHEGYISRASSLVSSPGLAAVGEATAQILRNLWSLAPLRPTTQWTPPDNLTRINLSDGIRKEFQKKLI